MSAQKKDLPLPITQTTLVHMMEDWLAISESGENALIIYPPYMDRLRRIQDFLTYVKKRSPVHFVPINVRALVIEDQRDWEEFITSHHIDPEEKTVFLISDAEVVISQLNIAETFAQWYIAHPQHTFILFSERFPYATLSHPLLQHIQFQPLYDQTDTENFLTYLSQKFNVKLTDARKTILQNCGGHFWLVKQAVRFLSQEGDIKNLFTHDAMELRIKSIYEALTQQEKDALVEILNGHNNFDVDAYNYLTKTKIVHNGDITIPLLKTYIHKLIKQQIKFLITDKTIILNKVDITKLFSKQEYALFIFMHKRRGTLISREDIGNALWKNENGYSDWAIDQLIRRLRTKLQHVGAGRECIQTHKGKGYYFSV